MSARLRSVIVAGSVLLGPAPFGYAVEPVRSEQPAAPASLQSVRVVKHDVRALVLDLVIPGYSFAPQL